MNTTRLIAGGAFIGISLHTATRLGLFGHSSIGLGPREEVTSYKATMFGWRLEFTTPIRMDGDEMFVPRYFRSVAPIDVIKSKN